MTEYLAPGVFVEEMSVGNIKMLLEELPLPASEISKLDKLCRSPLINTKGLTALFTGPSGTSKTLTAEVIANITGWPLYKVDLGLMVSKYIGETEKNLNKVFELASEAEVVLFFDEADALFGKRTEINEAHDRYVNSEVNYLLQNIETFDGMVIVATNSTENMDNTFLQNLHTIIEFPLPEPPRHKNLWHRLWRWLKNKLLNVKM